MIAGQRVYLRLMEEQDVPFKVKWINDPDIHKTLNCDYPISVTGTTQWLRRVREDDSRRDFIICLIDQDRPIGYAGLLEIDRRNRKAEAYIGLGERDCWGKGYARETLELLKTNAVRELGLHRIYLYTWILNTRMIALAEICGFQIEGTLRADIFTHEEFRDRVLMSWIVEKQERNPT